MRTQNTKIRMVGRFLRHSFSRLHPFEIQASVTNRCNLNCRYCSCPTLSAIELSTQQWLNIINSARKAGTIRFKFQGGEPTLRSDIQRLVTQAREVGMITAMTTNGLEIAKRLELINNIHELVLSLDSLDEQTNDALRGKGSYRSVMKVIDFASIRKVKLIINMVVSKVNFHKVNEMQAFCEKAGIVFHAQPVVFGRKAYNEKAKDIQLSRDETCDLHRRLAGYIDQGKRMLFSKSTYLRVLQWPDFNRLNIEGTHPSRCFAGRFYAHIEPDGDLFPCSNHVGTFDAKNIVHDGFRPALIHAQNHQCKDCWHPYFNERKALFRFNYQAVKSALTR